MLQGISEDFINRCAEYVLNTDHVRMNEVPFVIALLHVLPTILNSSPYSQVLMDGDKYRLRFDGYIVHGRPFAKFTSKHRGGLCELGDLLFVCHDIDRNMQQAMLLQAKMSREEDRNKGYHLLSDDSSLKQLELFRTWPLFAFQPGDENKKYAIFQKEKFDGAMYLLLRQWDRPIAAIDAPKEKIWFDHDSFGLFLDKFLRFKTGEEFSFPCPDNGWSGLVTELISYVRTHSIIHCNPLKFGYDIPRATVGGGEAALILTRDCLDLKKIVEEEVSCLSRVVRSLDGITDDVWGMLYVMKSKSEAYDRAPHPCWVRSLMGPAKII